MVSRRIHITGASGAGVSTLGQALAARLQAAWFDTDDVYWMPTTPPFTVKRDLADRVHLLRLMVQGAPACVLSGALSGWGDPIAPLFDAVVFVSAPTNVRLDRLRGRERERYGDAIAPGGAMHETHLEFMAWAAAYDGDTFPGRSRNRHEAWFSTLTCPVLRVDGERPADAAAEELSEILAPHRQ